MASLLPPGKQCYLDNAGNPLVGGKLYTYGAGTSTPKNTFSDATGLVPLSNPVILDSRGEATIFWTGAYKVVLKDSLDNVIWTVDNVLEFGVGDLITSTTGSMILPTGTTSQRDPVPHVGYIRYNIDTDQLEMYYAGEWDSIQRQLYSSGPNQNIKTIGGQSPLGTGDISAVPGAVSWAAVQYFQAVWGGINSGNS